MTKRVFCQINIDFWVLNVKSISKDIRKLHLPEVKEWGHLNGTARAFYAKPRKVEPCFFSQKRRITPFCREKEGENEGWFLSFHKKVVLLHFNKEK